MQNAPHVNLNPIDKALWYIESRFSGELTLDEVARAAGLSRFHMTRAFGMATGLSIMRYVRGRRLTEAARALANGAPDILSVAIDWGYGSHEAFTRAFRDQFGVTPEEVRAMRRVESLNLMEPLTMNETPNKLEPPRFVDAPAMTVAGMTARYTDDSSGGIPSQWQRFAPWIGRVPGQAGPVAYGVCYNYDEESGNIEYLSGVEVKGDGNSLPKELTSVKLPAHRYAVFTHRGHISTIRGTWAAIFREWVPKSGQKPTESPSFERYDERFDPKTGNGELEIWLPVS